MTRRDSRVGIAFDDPLAVPPGVTDTLSDIERKGSAMLAQLRERMLGAEAILPLVRLVEDVERVIGDGENSTFSRTLRITAAQLSPSSPPVRALLRRVEALQLRVDSALRIQDQVDELRREFVRRGTQFRKRLPYSVRVIGDEARLTFESLTNVWCDADIESVRNRLAWWKQRLETLELHLPKAVNADALAASAPVSDAPSFDELSAIFYARLAQRRSLSELESRVATVRGTIARHSEGMVRVAGRAIGGREPADQVALELATLVARTPRAIGQHFEDTSLWFSSIKEAWEHLAASSLHARRGDSTSGTPESAPTPADEWSVLPLGGGYVAITTVVRTAFIVRDMSRALANSEVTLEISHPFDWMGADLALFDAGECWTGIRNDVSAWYAVDQAAMVQLLEGGPTVWFGRLLVQGSLTPSGRAPWIAEQGQATLSLRVLYRPHEVPTTTLECGPPIEEPSFFLGFRTARVLTPLAGYDSAWLRTAEPATPARVQALSRERALFTAFEGGIGSRRGLHYLGEAAFAGGKGPPGFLYGMPVAVRLADSDRMRQWMMRDEASTLSFVRAVARLARAVMNAGYSIGIYHENAIAFGATRTKSGTLKPTAVLLHAPLATRLGDGYAVRLPATDLRKLTYASMRFRGLPDVIADGAEASLWTEKVAFSLFALNILATLPLIEEQHWFEWTELPAAMRLGAQRAFPRNAAWANTFGRTLTDPARAEESDQFFSTLAKDDDSV